MNERVMLLVGTKKGGFVIEGDRTGGAWAVRGPLCDGWPLHDMSWDPATGSIYAAGDSPWYGPAVFRSDDRGLTWTHSSEGLTYGDAGPQLKTVWNVTPSAVGVFAGVEPAGLFRSVDHGGTWHHVETLRQHPTTPHWQPGNGGLCLHSIVVDPDDPRRIWVGISAVGTFFSPDGGATWETRNRGVRADFQPEKFPEFGQCVHKLVKAAGEKDLLLQQNHCGVYRSRDAGAHWEEITGTLPSEFGFPMVGHPRDGATAWVIPLKGPEQGRTMPDDAAAVWRTRDAGDSWTRLGAGLPQEHAFLGVLREAMAVDRLEPAGVYFGTSTGQLYASADEGERWSLVADFLPPIWSVEAVAAPD